MKDKAIHVGEGGIPRESIELPWRIGQRVRFHDPEAPRPLEDQLRGTVVSMALYLDPNGWEFGGVQVHWDDAHDEPDTGDDIDDYVSPGEMSYEGIKPDDDPEGWRSNLYREHRAAYEAPPGDVAWDDPRVDWTDSSGGVDTPGSNRDDGHLSPQSGAVNVAVPDPGARRAAITAQAITHIQAGLDAIP